MAKKTRFSTKLKYKPGKNQDLIDAAFSGKMSKKPVKASGVKSSKKGK